MIFPANSEILLIGLVDAGVPNKERIVLRPLQPTSLAPFAVLAGKKLADGSAFPLWDSFFWFGDLSVSAPSWIVLYTGPGDFRLTSDVNTKEPIYEFHWHRPVTFADGAIVPIIMKIGALTVGLNPLAPAPPPAPPPLPSRDALKALGDALRGSGSSTVKPSSEALKALGDAIRGSGPPTLTPSIEELLAGLGKPKA